MSHPEIQSQMQMAMLTQEFSFVISGLKFSITKFYWALYKSS